MAKKFTLLFALVLMVSLAGAMENDLVIKDIDAGIDKVSISVLMPGSVYSLIESFHVVPDANREARVTFSTSSGEVDVRIWLKKEGEVVLSERYDSYETGQEIVIDLDESNNEEEIVENISEEEVVVGGEIVNTTIEDDEIVEDSDGDDEVGIDGGLMTGMSVFKDIGIGGSKFFYIIGFVIVLAGAILFFVFRPKGVLVESRSDSQTIQDAEGKLKRATQELSEARQEIESIKQQDGEVLEAEEQFRKAKENLEALKKGVKKADDKPAESS